VPVLAALILVTAVWGVTFVQVKDAVALYPLFAFLAVRFAIATVVLAPVAAPRLRLLDRRGVAAGGGLGLLLAAGYALQTAGLERTTVSSTGFVTGLYVVFTPLLALALFGVRIGRAVWAGVAVSTGGLALLSGVGAASSVGAVSSLRLMMLPSYISARCPLTSNRNSSALRIRRSVGRDQDAPLTASWQPAATAASGPRTGRGRRRTRARRRGACP